MNKNTATMLVMIATGAVFLFLWVVLLVNNPEMLDASNEVDMDDDTYVYDTSSRSTPVTRAPNRTPSRTVSGSRTTPSRVSSPSRSTTSSGSRK